MTRKAVSAAAAAEQSVVSSEREELIKLLLERTVRRSQEIRPRARSANGASPLLPTSWAQQRLWFIDQLEGASAGYQVPVAARIRGALDVNSLRRALDRLVLRHEALRTVFVSNNGDPAQQVKPDGSFDLQTIDLRGFDEAERETHLHELKLQEIQRRFDLRTGPLIRGILFQLRDDEWVLLVNLHHIIVDGWSKGVFFAEFTELYTAYAQGLDDPLEPLPIQYADYAQWQRQQWANGSALESQLEYWRSRLAGAPQELELPTDRPRPMRQSYRGETAGFVLDSGLISKLVGLARHYEMTLFMVLYAGWVTLLSRLSGQEDVVVGTPIANRQRPELEKLIGFFVNTLALRVKVDPDMSVEELFRQVKEVTLGAYDHQEVPFEKVVEVLQPQRRLSRGPLFQAMFVLHTWPNRKLRLPNLSVRIEDDVDEPSILDLWAALEQRDGEIIGSVNYSADLFDRRTVQRWMACYSVLLTEMAGNTQRRLGELPMLPEPERRQVIEVFNATGTEYPHEKSVDVLFEEQALRTPDAIAIRHGDATLSYAELNNQANRLASYLVTQGVGAGDYIPIFMERSVELIVAMLAVLKAGAVYVPVDPTLPVERQAFIVKDCNAQRAINEADPPSELQGESIQWLHFRHGGGDSPVEGFNRQRNPSSAAYIMYTSGSTGVPKGVVVPHRAIARLVLNTNYVHIGATDCVAHGSNPAFDAATFEIWGALLNGAALLIVPQSTLLEVNSFVTLLKAHRVTVLWLTVGLLTQYAESLASVLPQIRCLITGGDVVDPGMVRRVMERGAPQRFLNAYGPTEGTTFTTTHLIEEPPVEGRSIPIGRPIANTRVYILNSCLQPVPIGVTGEIYIGGAGVACGYLNRPELTLERFVSDPFAAHADATLYKTGDLGRWRADGAIDFLGRNDRQVKIRGYRVELGEIETRLLQCPQVKEAVVLAREDEPGEKRLVAYIAADLSALNSLQTQDVEEASTEVVERWKSLYEDTYQTGAPGPTFVGWNSSYTGQPIPEPQMREWLNATLERIQALKGDRVLEIGCGVGLLLQHLAPECEVYVGTDFSAAAIGQLRQWISTQDELQHVELLHRPATELQDLPVESFDLIVLNSVVQYFPNIEYLLLVLERAAPLLRPGGKIFVGDVRHLGLLPLFHSAVQLSRAAVTVNIGQLRKRVERAVAQDKELVIDPEFFRALRGHIPQINSVQVQWKQGEAHNELTRYRYDVILGTGAHSGDEPACESVDWNSEVGSIAALQQALQQKRWRCVRVHSIPNSRLASESAALNLIRTGDPLLEAGAARRELNNLKLEGVDPNQIWQLGREAGYDVQVSGGPADSPETLDVQLLDRNRAAVAGKSPSQPVPGGSPKWSDFANDPLEGSLRQQVVTQVRKHLQKYLPEFMVPSAWVTLRQLPLTPNGKIDRNALPAPQLRGEELGEYVAPDTEIQRALARIWAQLLRVDQVGIRDNFFELGGHSLLATRVITHIGHEFEVDVPLRTLFEGPTVEQLSDFIVRQIASELAEETP
jgi:amino acid adenylation domain-containing protein